MPKWVAIVLLIASFFVVALIAERRRVKGLEAWCRLHDFAPMDPFEPGGHPSLAALAARAAGRELISLRWAPGVAGRSGGTAVTLVPFEYTPLGRKTSVWFTLAAWPAPEAPGPFVFTPGDRNVMDKLMSAAWRPFAETGTESRTVKAPAVPLDERSKERRRALQSWPHGGTFVVLDGHAGWVSEGLLSPALADQLLARIEDARRVLAAP